MRPEPVTLILLRHGVTDFTVAGRLDGRGGPDPALNDLGLRQAAAAGQAIAETQPNGIRVVTSSLQRAMQTGQAAATALGLRPTFDRDWDEQSFGAWDGLTFKEIGQRQPDDVKRLRADDGFCVERGESHNDLAQRVIPALDRALAGASPGDAVIVATHRLPILVVLKHVLGLTTERAWLLEAKPASLTRLQFWESDRAVVSSLNDTHHLRAVV